MQPFELSEQINGSLTCRIFPRPKFPNGLYLTYESCPERYDNETAKLIRYCCFNILYHSVQNSNYKKTQDWLRYNSSSLLVLPAVLFNILSLAVLRRFHKLRGATQTSTTFYMKCLCIFDMLTIISKFLYEVIVVRNGLRKHPLLINSFMCKFLSFAESCCAISSIYLLIAMSIDKLICVLIPLKVGQILTKGKAKAVFALILLFSSTLSSYNLFDKRVFQFESGLSIQTSEVAQQKQMTNTHTNLQQTMPTSLNMNFSQQNASNSNKNSSQTQTQSNLNAVRISYDCDSNWPHLLNDWILLNNIIRVFLPILVLCICNSWIGIALARAKRNTEAIFRGQESSVHNNSNAGMTSSASKQNIALQQELNRNIYSSESLFNKEENNIANSKKQSEQYYLSDDNDEYESHYRLSEFRKNSSLRSNKNQQLQRKSGLLGHHTQSHASAMTNASNYNAPHCNTKLLTHIRGRNSTQHISIMLIAVSVGFIILNLPFAIRTLFHRQFSERFKILDYLYHDENLFIRTLTKNEIKIAIKYEFFSSLTHLLIDLNYIANFFLYFFSGSRFRAQLCSMMKCKKSNSYNNKTLMTNHMSRADANNNNLPATITAASNMKHASKNDKKQRSLLKNPYDAITYIRQHLSLKSVRSSSSRLNRSCKNETSSQKNSRRRSTASTNMNLIPSTTVDFDSAKNKSSQL
jgi:hypothetical protein